MATVQREETVPLRMQIYGYVREHPAAHILEIARAFDLTHPTVMYHLDLLQDEGYLVSSIYGKRRVHFDTAAHFNGWERELLALLAQDEARSILEYVAENPGTFPREIARNLSVSETTVKRYVPELLRMGVIQEVSSGFRKRLALAKSFERKGETILEKAPGNTGAAERVARLVAHAASST